MRRIVKKKIWQYVLMLVFGMAFCTVPKLFLENGSTTMKIIHRINEIYMVVVLMMILNSALLLFLDFYSGTDKNRSHPLRGLIQVLQVAIYFVGGIIIVSIVIGKSPNVLLTGLGASAAVLMLIFKDSILGFVAGVQLSQNNMIRLGDWIQMPDGSANGTVEEITLNTVKVRNWDNTLSMIPPYTLVSAPFKNWRAMQESDGRQVDKRIFLDMNTLAVYNSDKIAEIAGKVPLIEEYLKGLPQITEMTNIQLYRIYIELYLKTCPIVNSSLDLIVTQKEATAYGLPVEVYFFTKEKSWAVYEQQQSDIFDHIMTMAPVFGLKLYQRP